MIRIAPEFGVEIPPQIKYMDLRERAAAACETIKDLQAAGLVLPPCDEDTFIADTIAQAYAEDPRKTSRKVGTENFADLKPAAVLQVHTILDEFGHLAVQNALRVRYMVQNKLIIESENPDPKIRLRALEMLGKMDDVNMFTEKKEHHNINYTPEEIETRLREKLIELKKNAEGVYE